MDCTCNDLDLVISITFFIGGWVKEKLWGPFRRLEGGVCVSVCVCVCVRVCVCVSVCVYVDASTYTYVLKSWKTLANGVSCHWTIEPLPMQYSIPQKGQFSFDRLALVDKLFSCPSFENKTRSGVNLTYNQWHEKKSPKQLKNYIFSYKAGDKWQHARQFSGPYIVMWGKPWGMK